VQRHRLVGGLAGGRQRPHLEAVALELELGGGDA
jgi:hypothetical protein